MCVFGSVNSGRGLLVALMSEGSFRTIYREDGKYIWMTLL